MFADNSDTIDTWDERNGNSTSPYRLFVGGGVSNLGEVRWEVPDDFEEKQAKRARGIAESAVPTAAIAPLHRKEPVLAAPPVVLSIPRASLRRSATAVRNWRRAA